MYDPNTSQTQVKGDITGTFYGTFWKHSHGIGIFKGVPFKTKWDPDFEL